MIVIKIKNLINFIWFNTLYHTYTMNKRTFNTRISTNIYHKFSSVTCKMKTDRETILVMLLLYLSLHYYICIRSILSLSYNKLNDRAYIFASKCKQWVNEFFSHNFIKKIIWYKLNDTNESIREQIIEKIHDRSIIKFKF